MKHSYHTYFLISHFCSIQLLYNNYKLLYSKLLKTYNILCSNINRLYKYMMLHINSWHSISMDSSSLHSTKYRSNLLKNNYLYWAQTCFLHIGLSLHKMKVIYHDLKVYRMIDILIWKYYHILYGIWTYTDFGIQGRPWNLIPHGYHETAVNMYIVYVYVYM